MSLKMKSASRKFNVPEVARTGYTNSSWNVRFWPEG
jgi:hypothetical protein